MSKSFDVRIDNNWKSIFFQCIIQQEVHWCVDTKCRTLSLELAEKEKKEKNSWIIKFVENLFTFTYCVPQRLLEMLPGSFVLISSAKCSLFSYFDFFFLLFPLKRRNPRCHTLLRVVLPSECQWPRTFFFCLVFDPSRLNEKTRISSFHKPSVPATSERALVRARTYDDLPAPI